MVACPAAWGRKFGIEVEIAVAPAMAVEVGCGHTEAVVGFGVAEVKIEPVIARSLAPDCISFSS